MGMPSVLKNFNVFNDGESYMGQVSEVVLPKLTRKMEEWRGGGMQAPIKIDLGQEAITMEATYGGIMRSILKQYGSLAHDGVQLRFAGSLSAENGTEDAIEVVVRGRHSEIDPGNAKPGDMTAFKVTTECSYYKLTIANEVLLEIDVLGSVFKVNGVDLWETTRKNLGL